MPEEKLDLRTLARAASRPADANPVMAAESSKFDPGSGFSIDPTPEYYSKNLDYLNEARAQNQSTINRWGLAGLRIANKIGVELASVPGYLAGAAEAAFTDASIGEALDNHYLNSLKEYENTVNEEYLKVYVPDSVKNGGLAANLGSASFWATEGADGIGFLASMLIPGNALKLLKLGNLAAETGNLALKGYKYLKPASTVSKFGSRAAGNFDNFTAALVNSTVEAAAEAKETFDTSLSEMQSSFMEENGLTDPSQIPQNVMQDLRMRAGEASSSVFKWNAALLLGPNMIDQANLFGAFGSNKGLFASMFDDIGKLGTYTARETKDKLLNYALGVGKGFAKEGLFEEGSQFAISEYFKGEAVDNNKDKRISDDFIGIVKSYVDNLDNVDMQKSIALGGILGGPMSLYGTYKEEQYASKYGKIINEQLQNGLIGMYTGILDVIERDPVTNKMVYELDKATGKQVPKLDPEKAKELFQQPENNLLLNNLADVAMVQGNKEDSDLYRSIIHYNYFKLFFEQGKEGLDILKRHIQGQLANKEMDKQVLDEIFQISGSKTETEVVTDLLAKADAYYQLYDDINNRHAFDMPSLQGGTKDQRRTFGEMMRNKKLEKGIFKSKSEEIVKKIATQKTELLYKIALNTIKPEDAKTAEDAKINEGDKKQLEFLEKKEAQYKGLLEKINEDTVSLYDKPSIQEAYNKWVKETEIKKAEDEAANQPDDDVAAKFSKDLTDAGYVMDREHSLDPDKKSKLSPEELEKFKGQDKSFYFELNGKEYEAYSQKDPATGKYKRVYRDAQTKQVVGEFTLDFLKKNKNLRIINKQEATDRRKLDNIRKNKAAKLEAFDVIYNAMLRNFTDNKNALEDLYSKRIALKEEIELYKNWISEITNEYGRAANGKAQEKRALLDEIKRVEALIAAIDLEIVDNNTIYESLERQYNLLLAIKEDFEIYKENGVFKTEQDTINLSEFASAIKEQINQELEQLIQEEQQVNEMLNTAKEAVAVAEQSLNEALDLKIELEIIFEDLTRVKDINDIIRLLMTADFREDAQPRFNENGRPLPSALTLLTNKYKPLRLIYEAVEKLRNNTITDEEYIRLIGIANNLLTDTYLGFGFQGLTEIKNEISKAVSQAKQIPLSAQIEFRLNQYNFIPNRIIGNLLDSKTKLLDAANKLLAQVTDDRKAISDKIEPVAKQLGVRESELNSLMNDLFVQYKKFLNRGSVKKASFNNEAPDNQAPTVYDNPENRVNPASFLANFIFRSIGVDINYDEKTGKTNYVNGLPQLNENDENFRRLQQFIDENPDLASTYNVRFFIARTDAEGNTSLNLGSDQSNAELLGLYNAIGMPAGDLSIGFYLEDKNGKFATQNYKGSDKMVMGWIPQSITDTNGRLRINNATAVSIVTGFDIKKDKVKMINKYDMSEKDGVYTFNGTNNKKESNVTVTIVDGKAVIKSRFDVLSENEEALTISDDKAKEIAHLLKENSAYSLSRAGKEIYTLLKQSKTKYHNYVELTREKTDFIESASVFDSYGEITLEDLINKSKEALAGKKGLYQTSVIDKLVGHIETDNKKAFVGIQQVTGGVALREYEVDPNNPDPNTNTLFNKPAQNKVTKAFPVKFDNKGNLQGATVEVVDFTNAVTLGYQPGTVVLRLKNSKGNYTGEVVPLNQRTLNSNEILTALFIMSTADETNAQAPPFGKTTDGKVKFMRTSKTPKGFSKYNMLPFNKTSNVSAITSLLYWGKHNENFYTDAQGNKVPMTSGKVGEIFYHEGQVYFKRKNGDGNWIDASISIAAVKQALASREPLQDPMIADLVTFLADKRVNVNKELLANDGGSLYFHPTVTKTATGYEFGYQSFDSYQEFLLSGSSKFKEALTTNAPTKENFPKFANKMLVFKSTNRIVPFIKEEFVEPKEEAPAATRRKATRTKVKAATPTKAKEASDSELSKKFKEKQKEKRKGGQKERMKAKLLALEAEDESQEEETANEIASGTGTGGLMKGGKIEFKKKAPAASTDTKIELNNLKDLIAKTSNLSSIMDDIFKVLDEVEYEAWQEKLDEEKLIDDLKESLEKAKSEEEQMNIISKYLLPKFIDEQLAALEEVKPTVDARVASESKALEILNRYAERSDNVTEYQGDELGDPTSEDEEGSSTTTLGKIINAIKSLPPVPYNLTSKNIEEFKEKLKNELLDGGLDDMVDDVISNIDKLVDEQLTTSQSTTTVTTTTTSANPFGKKKTGLGVASTAKVNKTKNDQDINC